jgi:ABC-type antimicrobial peptide transport system permease subunit
MDFRQIRQLFRIIFRNRTFSILNISGLAIGITCAALILLWVEYQINDNRSVPKIKQLYEIGQNQHYGDVVRTFFVSPGPLSEALNSGFTGIRTSARYNRQGATFELDGKQFFENGAYTDSTLPGMIDLPFVAGNPVLAFEPAYPVLVSQTMAEKIFNSIDILGETLKVGNNLFEVTGVFKDREINGTFRFEWLIPLRVLENEMVERGFIRDNWGNNWLNCFVEIEAAADVKDINSRLTGLYRERFARAGNNEMFIYPVNARRLYGEFIDGKPTGGGYIGTVRIFFWVGLAILLIACINFMNLSTARSEKRALEVGVRKTFGAKYAGLVRRFMAESSLITLISVALAVLLVYMVLPMFNNFINYQLAVDFTNPYHLFGLTGVGVLCAFLSGAYPALYLSSFAPIKTLKKMTKGATGGVVRVRKGLVVFQFAVSYILICTTTVIYLQLHHVYRRPPGMELDRVVYFQATDEIKRNFEAVQHELINTGYVAGAGLSSQRIIQLWSNAGGYHWQGRDENINPLVSHVSVSPGVFAASGIRFVEGNDFSFQNLGGRPEVIINRSFAEIMGEEGRVGGFVSRGGDPMPIIGVVEDFIYNDISRAKVEPVIFFQSTGDANNLLIKFAKDKPLNEAIPAIQKSLQAYSPENPFTATFMDETFDNMFSGYRFTGKLATLFAVLAIVLSCLGLFGLTTYSAEQRRREIGIRKVFGASVWNVVVLLANSFIRLVVIAFVIAMPIAWYVGRNWLQSYGYKISLEWYIFLATALIIIIIAVITVSIQSVRAAMANPVEAIKGE